MILEGKKIKNENFIIHEDYAEINLDKVYKMLDPNSIEEIPVYVIRNFYNKNICNLINNEFENILKKTNGGNRNKGFVAVNQVGATQFKKSTKDYFKECVKTSKFIKRILNSLKEEYREIYDDFFLKNTFQKFANKIGINYRPSMYKKNEVNLFTMRRWKNLNKGLALLPHEDLSQLTVANKENYEIGKVKKVIACNLCIRNDEEIGGNLVLWNISPSQKQKKKLAIEKCGYPYPIELLKKIEKLSIQVKTGDLYFINANLVHAVTESKADLRVSLGHFIGINHENDIIYWT